MAWLGLFFFFFLASSRARPRVRCWPCEVVFVFSAHTVLDCTKSLPQRVAKPPGCSGAAVSWRELQAAFCSFKK